MIKKKAGNVLAIQSYGWIKGSNDFSRGARGSRARIRHAVNSIKEGIIPEKIVAVFPQGWPYGRGFQGEHLGNQMKRYFLSQIGKYEIPVETAPLGWGTEEDVVNAIRLARTHGFLCGNIFFVSDAVHIKRVELIWNHRHPTGWAGHFIAAPNHRLSVFERWIREPFARLAYMIKIAEH